MRNGRLSQATPEFRISRRVMLGQLVAAAGLAVTSRAFAQALIVPPPLRAGRYQFTVIQPQRLLPSAPLQGLDGKTTELSQFHGKATLLNFWATWCPPCRVELPILDRLQAVQGDRLNVIAVSTDRDGRKVVAPFVRELQLRMPVYLDPQGELAYSDRENRRNAPFALYGMPITYAITPAGRIVGYIPGAADWNSREGLAFLDFLEAH